MNNLDDLIRRNVQTLRPRTNGHPPEEPVDELTALIRQQQADSVQQLRMEQLKRQQRVAEMAAEAEALRAENDLEEERLRQEERRAERRALRTGGGQPDGAVLPAIMDMMVQSQRDTQARLDAINAASQEALKGELGALKDLIRAVMEKPQPNAIETIREQLAFFQTLQELAPKPAPTPQTSSLKEMLEVERVRAEIEMERARFQRDLQRDDTDRAKWEAEAQAAQNRAQMLGGMIQSAFPQLTEAVTARIAGRPEQDKLAPPAAAPPGLPWPCPTCGTTNYAPAGTERASCAKCEQIVDLEPAAEPAAAESDPED